MTENRRRKGAATALVGGGLVVGGAHLRQAGLQEAVHRGGKPGRLLGERALRGTGRGPKAAYAAGALAGLTGGTGMIYGTREVLRKSDSLLLEGAKGNVQAVVQQQRERRKSRKRDVAIDLAGGTAAGIGGTAAYQRFRPGQVGRANLVGVGALGGYTAVAGGVRRKKQANQRPSSKALIFDARRQGSKDAFRRGVVPSDVRKAHLLYVAKSVSQGLTPDQQRKQARKKQAQALISTAGGVAGLTGLAALGASKSPRAAAALRRTPQQLERTSTTSAVIGGGIGGVGALNFAGIQRREAKAERAAAVRKAASWGRAAPTGLRQRKTYTASSIRGTSGGRLVRTKAGVR